MGSQFIKRRTLRAPKSQEIHGGGSRSLKELAGPEIRSIHADADKHNSASSSANVGAQGDVRPSGRERIFMSLRGISSRSNADVSVLAR
jgi:hypothetical protein